MFIFATLSRSNNYLIVISAKYKEFRDFDGAPQYTKASDPNLKLEDLWSRTKNMDAFKNLMEKIKQEDWFSARAEDYVRVPIFISLVDIRKCMTYTFSPD